jgi:thiol-disulfide isomerase/thioredoxin
MTLRSTPVAAVAAAAAFFAITLSCILGQDVSAAPDLPITSISFPFAHSSYSFPDLNGGTAWINSAPLTPASLKGKVVLIEFWTFTCVNWRRESPYVRAWASKYADSGLTVIGVHSPEFGFEKDTGNVRRAVNDIGISYPVAVDSNLAIWRAFGNAYWPGLYFIDAQGRVRGTHFGEGDYEKSERLIQKLLTEVGSTRVPHDLAPVNPQGAELPADWEHMRSVETYMGYGQSIGFTSNQGTLKDVKRNYTPPLRISLNHWSLSGDWTVRDKLIQSDSARSRVVYIFHARDLNLIMGPAVGGRSVRFRVTIDGAAPRQARGVDIDGEGVGTITQHRMYQLIRQDAPIVDQRFEIEFLDPGVEVFDFTFG